MYIILVASLPLTSIGPVLIATFSLPLGYILRAGLTYIFYIIFWESPGLGDAILTLYSPFYTKLYSVILLLGEPTLIYG